MKICISKRHFLFIQLASNQVFVTKNKFSPRQNEIATNRANSAGHLWRIISKHLLFKRSANFVSKIQVPQFLFFALRWHTPAPKSYIKILFNSSFMVHRRTQTVAAGRMAAAAVAAAARDGTEQLKVAVISKTAPEAGAELAAVLKRG